MSTSSSRTPSRNRRMTLAHMPPSSNNRRMSVDPFSSTGIPTMTAKGRPPAGRKSMMPRVDGRENMIPPSPGGSSVGAQTASSRRRSQGRGRKSLIPPPATQQVKDPRPITDKAFQQQCIKQLLAFLLESGYEYPISHKSLSRPSAKDFSNICTFMLRLVDPNFQTGTMKFEDEVVMNFKGIGYPFPISKTALVAAGAMHTWPSLLAALSWLMDNLNTKRNEEVLSADRDDADKPFESVDELAIKTEKAFFSYLGKAYTAFMSSDAVLTEQLETSLADRFERDDSYLLQEVERMTDLNADIAERINALTQKYKDLPTKARKREAYAVDLEGFHELIIQMDEHKAEWEQKVKERTAELAETTEKLNKMTDYVDDLKKTIENQELSPDDILAMESEMKVLGESMDRMVALRDKRRKILLTSEKELLVACNSLESTLVHYNAKLSDLQLVPKLGSTLADLKATLNKDCLLCADQSKIVGVDPEATVRPNVDKFKTKLMYEVEHSKADYQDGLDKLENTGEGLDAAHSKLQIVQDKIAKCEKTLENERETHLAKVTVRQREVQAMEQKVAIRRDPIALEEQMAAYERQCAELEALRLEHQETNETKKKAVVQEIQEACKLMADDEVYWEKKLQELEAYRKAKEAKMSTIRARDK